MRICRNYAFSIHLSGDIDGYNFQDSWSKLASWTVAMDTLGKLGPAGTEQLCFKRYYHDRFFLPFKVRKQTEFVHFQNEDK
jgi:hypothetical protein